MTDVLLDLLNEKYPLESLDVGGFSKMKVSGMNFCVSAYRAEALGHVSVMKAKGFFGLMKMDTLIIVPDKKDMPLYSYDRILAMGNDTLIIELYDTVAGSFDASALEEVKNRFSAVPERDPGEHWYDSIKLPQSISKKAKNMPELDSAAAEYLKAFLSSDAETAFNAEEKQKKTGYYVSGLLKNGGPSTDVFMKKFGEEKTKELFEKVLFGTKR